MPVSPGLFILNSFVSLWVKTMIQSNNMWHKLHNLASYTKIRYDRFWAEIQGIIDFVTHKVPNFIFRNNPKAVQIIIYRLEPRKLYLNLKDFSVICHKIFLDIIL